MNSKNDYPVTFPLAYLYVILTLRYWPADYTQLSYRSSGLIGADLFRGMAMILDFPHRRLAVHVPATSSPSSTMRR